MVQARRFHSYFLFFIPLTQGVLLVIILDFCKNAAFFAHQAQNLSPTTPTAIGNGQQVERPKDGAYLAAQYIYAIWLISMMLKAIVGLRANLKFNIRWMGIYNVLFGIDTGFEFIHTTLGVIFQDVSQLDEAGIIRHYCVGYLILILQIYGLFCCWIHLKWVRVEMPQLLASTERQETLYELMFPYCVGARARRAAATTNNVSPNSAIDPSSSISPNGASTATAPVAIDLERASTNPASSDSRPPILANNDTVQSSTSSDSEIQVAIQR